MNEISIVFPGQGSQRTGMAQDFVEQYPECRKLFEEASDKIGVDLLEICSSEDGRLDRTEYSQPALLTAEIAMFNASRNHFSKAPKYFAGHSLGEYSALVAADVIPFLDAVQIVRKRGLLMQNALPDGGGAMVALLCDNIDDTDYKNCVTECGAEVANYNSPTQVVISGRKEAVEASFSKLEKLYPEMRLITLNVSTPFHSSLMKGIEPEFREYLNSFAGTMQAKQAAQVLSNFSGDFHQPDCLIDNLVNQISGSVCWRQNMDALKSVSTEVFEFGPNRVLSKFCSSVGINAKTIMDIRSMQKNLVNKES
jgi:malonyl CoA-acyl carrier protein transacylase